MPSIPSSRSHFGRQLQATHRTPHVTVQPRDRSPRSMGVSVGASVSASRPLGTADPYEMGLGAIPVSGSGSSMWVPVRSTAQACVGTLMKSFAPIATLPLGSPSGSSYSNQFLLRKAASYAYNVLSHLGSGLRPDEAPRTLPPDLRFAGPCTSLESLLPATWMVHTTEEGWNVLYSVFQIASCLASSVGVESSVSASANALAHCLYPVFAFAPARLV